MQRIEIVGERRRAHDAAFRARVVEECTVSGTRCKSWRASMVRRTDGSLGWTLLRAVPLLDPAGGTHGFPDIAAMTVQRSV